MNYNQIVGRESIKVYKSITNDKNVLTYIAPKQVTL